MHIHMYIISTSTHHPCLIHIASPLLQFSKIPAAQPRIRILHHHATDEIRGVGRQPVLRQIQLRSVRMAWAMECHGMPMFIMFMN